MTPFFWYDLAIVVLITLAGVGLGLLISRIRPTIVICPGGHSPQPPAASQPRPQLEETTWRKPATPPRHVRPRSARNDDSGGMVSGSTAAAPSFIFRDDPAVPAASLTSDYVNGQQTAGGGL